MNKQDASPIRIHIEDAVATLWLSRPDKRNALNDQTIAALGAFFANPPEHVRAVILAGEGNHFSAGLDLSEHVSRSAEHNMVHSRNWHRVMDQIQFCGLPVLAVLEGAVIGGGLELAAACHIRIAEPSAIFQLPEGQRGIFVGGGATVRLGRILGADRMTEMMLTGRKYDAAEAVRLGLAHYATDAGQGMAKARELAAQVIRNAKLSNYLVIEAVARIQDMGRDDGLFVESLAAAMAQTSADAQEGLRAFLEKRPPKFR